MEFCGYAHYYATQKKKVVIISTTLQPIGQEIEVTGKREARKIAEAFAARPWNF